MGIWKIWYIFLRLWDITVHTRPDGDLENLGIEKCTARDLKITLLYSASHGVLDLVALTCLTSWMRGVPCSFYIGSTYALTFTSGCSPSVVFLCASFSWGRQVLFEQKIHDLGNRGSFPLTLMAVLIQSHPKYPNWFTMIHLHVKNSRGGAARPSAVVSDFEILG